MNVIYSFSFPPSVHLFIHHHHHHHHLLDDDDDDDDGGDDDNDDNDKDDDSDKNCHFHCHHILDLQQTSKQHIPYGYKHIPTVISGFHRAFFKVNHFVLAD